MIRIKKLHCYILKVFIPLVGAAFSICIFVLLMQFIWKYINDMIAKGASILVLIKLFFYACLSFTPTALPISILFASLITFGKLEKQLELFAIKTLGISLIRMMVPLMYFSAIVTLISFFFQNYIIPQVQTKMLTIAISLREKSPELEIPEKIFYKEIPGYNIYIKTKNRKTGALFDIKIYDYSKGFENIIIIAADSGKLNISSNKKYLTLTLYNGELFQNINNSKNQNLNKKILHRRELFSLRKILIEFDTKFKIKDESFIRNKDFNKNVRELFFCIDSIHHKNDSIYLANREYFKQDIYGIFYKKEKKNDLNKINHLCNGFDFYYNHLSLEKKNIYIQYAKQKLKNLHFKYQFEAYKQMSYRLDLYSQYIFLYKKFSSALACFFFFFIGAPLGSNIRKGNLDFPVILSVIIFIFYYTIDTFGMKLTKQGIYSPEKGMWLSTIILIIFGFFLSYQSTNDFFSMKKLFLLNIKFKR